MILRFLRKMVARKFLCSECRTVVVMHPTMICAGCLGILGFVGVEGLVRNAEAEKEVFDYAKR